MTPADKLAKVGQWVKEDCEKGAPHYREQGDAVLGEVYLQVFGYVERQNDLRDPRAYVKKCCRFEVRRACLKERGPLGHEAVDFSVVPDRNGGKSDLLWRLVRSEERAAALHALALLPEDDRTALEAWLDAEGRNGAVEALAKQWGCSLQAVYRRKDRALGQLRRMLGINEEARHAG
jgi:DNA-directed RNA polymerase specialized sigma24 family protein